MTNKKLTKPKPLRLQRVWPHYRINEKTQGKFTLQIKRLFWWSDLTLLDINEYDGCTLEDNTATFYTHRQAEASLMNMINENR